MIHCPDCGTANPEGSRFCSECGEGLSETGTRCPMCGTTNDVGEENCRQCNARLIPMSGKDEEREAAESGRPIRDISPPTDPRPSGKPEAEREENTSQGVGREDSYSHDWLDELRGSATEETEDPEWDDEVEESEEPMASADVASRLSEVSPGGERPAISTQRESQPTEDSSEGGEAGLAETSRHSPRTDSPSSADRISPLAAADAEGMDWEDTSPSEEDTLSEPGDTPEWLRGLDPTADDPPIADQTISDEEAEDESREEASELGEAPEWLREMELSAAPGTASYEQPQVGDEEQAIIQIPDWLKEAKGTESSEPPDEPEEESEAHRGGEPEVESGPGLQDKAEVEREREPPPEPETRPELGRTAEPRDLPRSEPDIESEVHREPKPADEIQGALETEPEPEPSAEPDAGPGVEAEAEPQRPPEADPGIESEAPIEPRPETGPALTPEEDTEEESEDEPEIEAGLDEELSKLRDRSGTEMAAWEGAAESTRLSPESVELPDWVKEAGGWAEEEPATEEPQAEESSEATDPEVDEESPIPKEEHWEPAVLPDWAEEVQGGPEESPPEGEQSPFATAAPETTEAPGWLSGLLAPGPPEAREPSDLPPEPGLAEEDWESDLERAEIPEWLLGLRPGQDEKKAVVRGPVETEGLLRGLRGVIPSTSIITAPADFEGLPASGPSEASLARAELLQSILGQAASTPRRGTREQAENTTGLVERWLVAGLLILTVLSRLVVLATADQPPRLTQPLTSPSAVNVHSAVDELAAGDKVLVAFDYGPAEVDELNPAAEPVIKHILDRGATLSIVSTRPDGPLVAEGFMSRITGAEGQYTIVGYRPGAASGVSQLLTAGDTSPDLLLILTGRAMPLRLWIEQARALYGERLPLATVGSAALEPVTSAYLDANVGQLTGAVHGLQGAASYETLRGIAGAATRRLDVLAAGHIAIVVLIIIGAVVCAVGGTEREEA